MTILSVALAFSWQPVTSANGQFPPLDSLRPVNYNGKIYSFGGFTENQDPSLANVWSNDVYVFDGSHWTLQATTGTKPTARGYEVAFVRQGGLYIVFGGSYDSSFGNVVQTNEMSRLDLTTFHWSSVSYSNPSAAPGGMFAPAGWYEPTKDALYIFGGINFKFFAVSSATYKFNFATNTWSTISSTANPSGRYDVSLNYAAFFGIATIYGGETLTPSFSFVIPSDVQWSFNVWTEQWTQTFPAASPTPARNNGNGAAFDIFGQTVMYGGDIGGGPSCPFWFAQNSVQETWVFSPLFNTWNLVPMTANPPPLKRAGTFFLNGLTYIYGGFYFTGCTLNRNQNTYVLI